MVLKPMFGNAAAVNELSIKNTLHTAMNASRCLIALGYVFMYSPIYAFKNGGIKDLKSPGRRIPSKSNIVIKYFFAEPALI
mmetsp:Transcript_9036/g.16446  ORF Transcript_9036/g.16446 Transcript_9036/m.16446 type:complete len:81 (+) Transcript_9036:854-1096(+)